ncbi:MAG: hypothetical protein R3F37_07835 [Candidatus Competibacteraceae bacterium]
MTWKIFFVSAATIIAVGVISDKMWGWLWVHKIKATLTKKSNYFFDMHFIPVLHNDISKVLYLLRKVFGKKSLSFRVVFISIAPTIVIFVFSIVNESMERVVPISLHAFLILGVMTLWTSLTVPLSLFATRYLLSRAKPSFLSLSTVTVVDVIVAYILMPIPFFFTILLVHGLSDTPNFSYVAYFVIVLQHWPEAILNNLGRISENYEYINFYALLGAIFFSALPTVLHLTLILRDVVHFTILRYFYLGLSGLFNYLSDQDYPMTKLLLGVGVVFSILKLWIDAIG